MQKSGWRGGESCSYHRNIINNLMRFDGIHNSRTVFYKKSNLLKGGFTTGYINKMYYK